MNKIIMFCKKHNIPFTVVNTKCNVSFIRIDTDDPYYYTALTQQLYKAARRYHWKIDSNYYAGTIRVYNQTDYDYITEQNNNMNDLVTVFYNALREGYDQQNAKRLQREYAIAHNMTSAFEYIYS